MFQNVLVQLVAAFAGIVVGAAAAVYSGLWLVLTVEALDLPFWPYRGAVWLLMLTGLVALPWACGRWAWTRLRSPTHEPYLCLYCGYNLVVTQARTCPECGGPSHRSTRATPRRGGADHGVVRTGDAKVVIAGFPCVAGCPTRSASCR